MAVRSFLQVTKESSYGTIMTTPVRGTDQIAIRLDGGNAFTMRANPVQTTVMYGGGWAVPAYAISDQTELKGALQLKLCYSQAQFLLGAALTRITGGTSPWTTTEPTGDLASFTIDHGIYNDNDGSFKRRRYTGCKVTGLKLDVSRDSKIASLSLDIQGSTPAASDPDATAFPIPADTDYPTDVVQFTHSSGGLTLGSGAGSVRTQYSGLSISVNNAVDARYFENRYVNIMRVLGRTSMLEADLLLKSTPDDRSAYEALTAQTAKLVLTNTTHTITLDYHGANIIQTLQDDLPLDKVFERKLTIANLYSASAGADLAFSFS